MLTYTLTYLPFHRNSRGPSTVHRESSKRIRVPKVMEEGLVAVVKNPEAVRERSDLTKKAVSKCRALRFHALGVRDI